ncbi:MAG: 1-phosphofructokinase [Actinomycetota bacterium]|nr:1-phosphofructokinase [Actinomycetota bacterium]
MIVTVTLNPSLDRTLQVRRLRRGEVHRAGLSVTDPGGKGVNVARCLSAHGDEVVAVVPVGGATGAAVASLLDEAHVAHDLVAQDGRTRANVSVVEPDGTTTKINEPGTPLRAAELEAVVGAASRRVGPGDWVVTAGSLPPGQDPHSYAEIGRAARACGARWAVDTSGDALPSSLAASPDLVKPNRRELEEVVGGRLDTVGAVVDAGRALLDRGVGTVLCSLGRDGAVLVRPEAALHAAAPEVRVRNTVGAGDSLLAGYLHGWQAGADAGQALRTGVAWAAAAVATPGTGIPAPELIQLDRVRVSTAADYATALLEDAS